MQEGDSNEFRSFLEEFSIEDREKAFTEVSQTAAQQPMFVPVVDLTTEIPFVDLTNEPDDEYLQPAQKKQILHHLGIISVNREELHTETFMARTYVFADEPTVRVTNEQKAEEERNQKKIAEELKQSNLSFSEETAKLINQWRTQVNLSPSLNLHLNSIFPKAKMTQENYVENELQKRLNKK